MAKHVYCPRCGARDSFIKGYLPETCLCRICQSQLDWREIPDCGPDCKPVSEGDEERQGSDARSESKEERDTTAGGAKGGQAGSGDA